MSQPDDEFRAPLRLGEPAPQFTARSTQGQVSLSDYRGRWTILVSHPGDFTPVCTSEFVALARAMPQFEALNCALIAVSVDSLYSHLAWVRAIHDHFDVAVTFPILEDPTMEIGRAYGMIGPEARDASPIRATYFLDPEGVMRASTWYPASVGRSVEEMLRTLVALQRVHDGSVLAPEGWRPGDDLLRQPAHLAPEALEGADPLAWFYARVRDSGAEE